MTIIALTFLALLSSNWLCFAPENIFFPPPPLPPLPCPVTMLMGCITDSDKTATSHHRLKDFQVRYAGYSCRTDQNGFYHFSCKEQKLFDPVFILISNGNYWTTQEDAIGNQTVKRLIVKQDPKKPHRFYKSRIENGMIFFDEQSLEPFCFELPSERTLLLNINPNYVEEKIEPNRHFFFNEGHLMLPGIRLKSAPTIKKLKHNKWKTKGINPCHSKKQTLARLKAKTWLRKCKHVPNHEEVSIRQTIRRTTPNRRNAFVLLSIPAQI